MAFPPVRKPRPEPSHGKLVADPARLSKVGRRDECIGRRIPFRTKPEDPESCSHLQRLPIDSRNCGDQSLHSYSRISMSDIPWRVLLTWK